MEKAFDIPTLDESIKRNYEAGLLTLEEATRDFYRANWSFTVDIEYTKRKLGIKWGKNI